MRALTRKALLLCVVTGLLRMPAPTDAARAQEGGFADVTRESGIESLLAGKYTKEPNWWLSGLYLVDLDNDGKLDLFFGAHGGGSAIATRNDGQGRFSLAEGNYPPTEIHMAYDVNEDGKLDLQMNEGDGGGVWWISESAPGRLGFTKSRAFVGTGRAGALIDLNRDGKNDWLHETRPGLAWEFGDGKGGFAKGGSLVLPSGKFETNFFPVDLNGDGFVDLVAHWGRYEFPLGRSRVLVNDGKMNFKDVTAECGLREEDFAVKGIGDVNQDGYPDLLVLEKNKPAIYLNDGTGHFTRREGALKGMEAATRPHYASWGLAVVTDFDNDGVPDIVWNGKHHLWILRGEGGGAFAYMNKVWGIEDTAAASVDDGICFGDLDGDGRLDIIGYTGNLDKQRRVKVYHNDLPARNWINVRPVGLPGNRGAAGAKIRLTGEGKLLWYEQVVVGNSQSAHTYYSYNVTERHYGLGDRAAADVSVEFYPSSKKVELKGVQANTTVEIREDGEAAGGKAQR